MITEDYVSFEIAKLLKEKGFDIICDKIYRMNGYLCPFEYSMNIKEEGYYLAPTLQMAMKWLREVHNIDIIAPPQFDSEKWTYSPIIIKLSIPTTEIRLNDNRIKKEEAVEAAIKYCLENLI